MISSIGKRNTSLAFFTSHERAELKSTWGRQRTRLTRESFLPIASCALCLQPAREPVACASGGHVFCRECAVANLLAQLKEIKRVEKELKRKRREEEERQKEKGNEERERVVNDFERVVMGRGSSRAGEGDQKGGDLKVRGLKRKFEIDEEEMLRNAKEERARARRELDEEKVCLPTFVIDIMTCSQCHPVLGLETHSSFVLGPVFNPQLRGLRGQATEAVAGVSGF